MRISVITPVKYQELNPSNLYVCYASHLADKLYRSFFTNKEGTIILDYGPKLPRRFDLHEMYSSIELIKPSIIVLPSVDYSYPRTNDLVEVFLRRKRFKQKLIGVVQGLDLYTLNKSYSFLRDKCNIIGLPSPLETVARREEIIRDLGIKEKTIYIEVHANPYEEIPPTDSMGIYTSYPVRLAANLRTLSEYEPTPPPLDFFRENLVEELVERNIEDYVEAVSNARSQG